MSWSRFSSGETQRPEHIFVLQRNPIELDHYLTTQQPPPNRWNADGWTALALASQRGQSGCASILLQHGHNPMFPTKDGLTPLAAVLDRLVAMCKQRADISSASMEKETAEAHEGRLDEIEVKTTHVPPFSIAPSHHTTSFSQIHPPSSPKSMQRPLPFAPDMAVSYLEVLSLLLRYSSRGPPRSHGAITVAGINHQTYSDILISSWVQNGHQPVRSGGFLSSNSEEPMSSTAHLLEVLEDINIIIHSPALTTIIAHLSLPPSLNLETPATPPYPRLLSHSLLNLLLLTIFGLKGLGADILILFLKAFPPTFAHQELESTTKMDANSVLLFDTALSTFASCTTTLCEQLHCAYTRHSSIAEDFHRHHQVISQQCSTMKLMSESTSSNVFSTSPSTQPSGPLHKKCPIRSKTESASIPSSTLRDSKTSMSTKRRRSLVDLSASYQEAKEDLVSLQRKATEALTCCSIFVAWCNRSLAPLSMNKVLQYAQQDPAPLTQLIIATQLACKEYITALSPLLPTASTPLMPLTSVALLTPLPSSPPLTSTIPLSLSERRSPFPLQPSHLQTSPSSIPVFDNINSVHHAANVYLQGALSELQPDLRVRVLAYLSPSDIAQVSLVDKRWYQASFDPFVWRCLYKYLFKDEWHLTHAAACVEEEAANCSCRFLDQSASSLSPHPSRDNNVTSLQTPSETNRGSTPERTPLWKRRPQTPKHVGGYNGRNSLASAPQRNRDIKPRWLGSASVSRLQDSGMSDESTNVEQIGGAIAILTDISEEGDNVAFPSLPTPVYDPTEAEWNGVDQSLTATFGATYPERSLPFTPDVSSDMSFMGMTSGEGDYEEREDENRMSDELEARLLGFQQGEEVEREQEVSSLIDKVAGRYTSTPRPTLERLTTGHGSPLEIAMRSCLGDKLAAHRGVVPCAIVGGNVPYLTHSVPCFTCLGLSNYRRRDQDKASTSSSSSSLPHLLHPSYVTPRLTDSTAWNAQAPNRCEGATLALNADPSQLVTNANGHDSVATLTLNCSSPRVMRSQRKYPSSLWAAGQTIGSICEAEAKRCVCLAWSQRIAQLMGPICDTSLMRAGRNDGVEGPSSPLLSKYEWAQHVAQRTPDTLSNGETSWDISSFAHNTNSPGSTADDMVTQPFLPMMIISGDRLTVIPVSHLSFPESISSNTGAHTSVGKATSGTWRPLQSLASEFIQQYLFSQEPQTYLGNPTEAKGALSELVTHDYVHLLWRPQSLEEGTQEEPGRPRLGRFAHEESEYAFIPCVRIPHSWYQDDEPFKRVERRPLITTEGSSLASIINRILHNAGAMKGLQAEGQNMQARPWRGLFQREWITQHGWRLGIFKRYPMVGHSDAVRCLAAHGDLVISGADDKTVRVWSASLGTSLFSLTGHTGSVVSVSTDGVRIASLSWEDPVHIWDVLTGRLLCKIDRPATSVSGIDAPKAVHLDQNLLIIGSQDGYIRTYLLYETREGTTASAQQLTSDKSPDPPTSGGCVTLTHGDLQEEQSRHSSERRMQALARALTSTLASSVSALSNIASSPGFSLTSFFASSSTTTSTSSSPSSSIDNTAAPTTFTPVATLTLAAPTHGDDSTMQLGEGNFSLSSTNPTLQPSFTTDQGPPNLSYLLINTCDCKAPVRAFSYSRSRRVLAVSADDMSLQVWSYAPLVDSFSEMTQALTKAGLNDLLSMSSAPITSSTLSSSPSPNPLTSTNTTPYRQALAATLRLPMRLLSHTAHTRATRSVAIYEDRYSGSHACTCDQGLGMYGHYSEGGGVSIDRWPGNQQLARYTATLTSSTSSTSSSSSSSTSSSSLSSSLSSIGGGSDEHHITRSLKIATASDDRLVRLWALVDERVDDCSSTESKVAESRSGRRVGEEAESVHESKWQSETILHSETSEAYTGLPTHGAVVAEMQALEDDGWGGTSGVGISSNSGSTGGMTSPSDRDECQGGRREDDIDGEEEEEEEGADMMERAEDIIGRSGGGSPMCSGLGDEEQQALDDRRSDVGLLKHPFSHHAHCRHYRAPRSRISCPLHKQHDLHHHHHISPTRTPPPARVVSNHPPDLPRPLTPDRSLETSALSDHLGRVRAVAFTQDLIVTGADDHTIKLWSVDNHECVLTLSGHDHRINGIAVTRGYMASASHDNAFKIWDFSHPPDTQTLRRSLASAQGSFRSRLGPMRLASVGNL